MATGDVLRTFRRLLTAAQRFERRAPKYQRVEAERQELRDAITSAALVLSVEARGGRVESDGTGPPKKPRKRVA